MAEPDARARLLRGRDSQRLLPAVGSCHGFTIRSELPLHALRPIADGPNLTVLPSAAETFERTDEPSMSWADENGTVFTRIYIDDDTFSVWVRGSGWYRSDRAAGTIETAGEFGDPRWEARLWSLPTALCAMGRGDLVLHAAAVDVGGVAVVLGAPGQYGKTTLAAAFAAAGYVPLSEDTTCVQIGDAPAVHPGSTLLRVRPDVFEHLPTTGMQIVAEHPDRVYLSLAEGMRGAGRPVPLAGVVLLRHGTGLAEFERVPPHQALRDLWSLSFKLSEDADRTRCLDGVGAVVGTTPVWNLSRRFSIDDLPHLVERIVETCVPS